MHVQWHSINTMLLSLCSATKAPIIHSEFIYLSHSFILCYINSPDQLKEPIYSIVSKFLSVSAPVEMCLVSWGGVYWVPSFSFELTALRAWVILCKSTLDSFLGHPTCLCCSCLLGCFRFVCLETRFPYVAHIGLSFWRAGIVGLWPYPSVNAIEMVPLPHHLSTRTQERSCFYVFELLSRLST